MYPGIHGMPPYIFLFCILVTNYYIFLNIPPTKNIFRLLEKFTYIPTIYIIRKRTLNFRQKQYRYTFIYQTQLYS